MKEEAAKVNANMGKVNVTIDEADDPKEAVINLIMDATRVAKEKEGELKTTVDIAQTKELS